LSGLIRLEVRQVVAGVRHKTVPAYATHHAARHRIMLPPPILRQSPTGTAIRLGSILQSGAATPCPGLPSGGRAARIAASNTSKDRPWLGILSGAR